MGRSLKSRLGALEQSTGRREVQQSSRENESQHSKLPSLGFSYEDMGEGGFWHRSLSYDLLSFYGDVRFQDILIRDLSLLAKACKLDVSNSSFTNRVSPKGFDDARGTISSPVDSGSGDTSFVYFDMKETLSTENLRFYDTETTGLGTGAGTFPFLHAIGQIERDEWVIHQYFVDDFSEEPALLSAIVQRHFREAGACISFNGKSFDWPLLLNRLVMYRIAQPTSISQMDLLHPSRRLWRRKLERVSLGHVEEGIMGVQRTDDLPGREAPARYFSYLQDGNVEQVRPVLDHNAADVSALLGLTVVLSDVLAGKRDVESAGEYAALGKWRDEWEDHDLADKCWRFATQCPDTTWREFWLSSLRHKRLKQWDRACAMWEDMARKFSWSISALIELAKYYEHREKDFKSALEFAQEALRRAQFHVNTVGDNTVVSALMHRIRRIERRMEKPTAN